MSYPILAPNSTWYKSSTARSTITQINIVDSYTPTGSENESWNADVDNTGAIKCYRTGTAVTIAGNGSGKIAANADSGYMFASTTTDLFSSLVKIEGAYLIDTSAVTSMIGMFNKCGSLTSLDVSNWNTSSCTNMDGMFNKCESLTSLDVSNWDVSNVTTMRSTFQGCTALTSLDVSNWDVSKVTIMRNTFAQSNYGLTSALRNLDVSKWDTSSCTDMGWMFYGCSKLGTLDCSNWDVSKVKSFHHMFAWSGLVIEGVENWDVSSAEYLEAMFHTTNYTSIDVSRWNVSKVKDFAQMFERCTLLTEIKGLENWDTSNAEFITEMFLGCQNLKELNLSSFDTRKVASSFYDEQRNQTFIGNIANMLGRRLVDSDPETELYGYMMKLEKLTLGENFSFNGDGTCARLVIPAPDPAYIDGADGYWYDEHGQAYTSETMVAGKTYHASKFLIDEEVLIRYGTMCRIANEIKELSGINEARTTSQMTADISNANGIVLEQADLIAQIMNVVDNLPEAGSGGGEASPAYTFVNTTDYDIAINGQYCSPHDTTHIYGDASVPLVLLCYGNGGLPSDVSFIYEWVERWEVDGSIVEEEFCSQFMFIEDQFGIPLAIGFEIPSYGSIVTIRMEE